MVDLAPQLGGQARQDISLQLTGREPVISGMGSRLLADRRGAYRRGNLRALLQMMSDEQRLAFRQRHVHQTLRYAQTSADLLQEVLISEERPRLAMEAGHRWWANPTMENHMQAVQMTTQIHRMFHQLPHHQLTLRNAVFALKETMYAITHFNPNEAAKAAVRGIALTVRALTLSETRDDALARDESFKASMRVRRAHMRIAYIILQCGSLTSAASD